MSLNIIGMRGAVTGGVENAIASIDIPQDGFIIGIDWDLGALLDATTEEVDIELSFIATNQLATNDVRGRISSVSSSAVVLTAVGINSVGIQKWMSGFDLIVAGGERIFLHSVATAGVVATVRCNLFFDSTGNVRRTTRRR